jgi:hypothetical protein
MDEGGDVAEPRTKFWHDASLKQGGGSSTLSVTGSMPVGKRGDDNNLGFWSSDLLFKIDQFARRNEVLLNETFSARSGFSTN